MKRQDEQNLLVPSQNAQWDAWKSLLEETLHEKQLRWRNERKYSYISEVRWSSLESCEVYEMQKKKELNPSDVLYSREEREKITPA